MAAMSAESRCIFCRIAAGAASAAIVHRDERALVFLDRRPVATGHLLVVPTDHAARLSELESSDAAHLMTLAQRGTRALAAMTPPATACKLICNDGVDAGQEVLHVHLHVVPRGPGDRARWPRSRNLVGQTKLDATAAALRAVWPPH